MTLGLRIEPLHDHVTMTGLRLTEAPEHLALKREYAFPELSVLADSIKKVRSVATDGIFTTKRRRREGVAEVPVLTLPGSANVHVIRLVMEVHDEC